MVGQTFDVIIAQQFQNLRDGDRFWYQNQGFDPVTLRAIESTTLSSLILKNTDTQHMQADAFVFYERRSGTAGGGVMENPDSPQLVIGSNGGDTLIGGTKGDLLVAGTGRQTMTGAAGSDTFIVSTKGVDAVITDFKVGQDRLQFENLGQPGRTGVRITSENGNAVITFAGTKITLTGVQASRIRISDISFI
jgi:Ca2+-binding RTX toxin-like protein